MKFLFRLFTLTIIFLLAACGSAETVPTQTPTAVPIAAEAQTEAEPSATAISSINLLPPATNTAVPEPATATAEPTSTNTAVPAQTGTAAPETTATETAPAETAVAASPSPAAAGNGGDDTATTAAPTAPAPPASPDGVTAPTDNNYPANTDRVGWENRIRVPAGFKVEYVGLVNGNPTSITFGPDGKLYIAMQQGSILTMDGSGSVGTYFTGLRTPTGIAFRPGTNQLYVSDRPVEENVGGESRVSVIEGGGLRPLITGLPCCYTFFHSAQGIAFGPDGMGYVGVGARADHGEILVGERAGEQDELHPYEAAILRFNPDSGAVNVYARGFRNPYDIAWDANGNLWATENQPDFHPPEELHRVVPGGEHGYPWYDCDVCFSPPPGVNIIPPTVTFAPRSSPTGVTAYLGSQFPGYHNSLFVTLWSAFVGAQKVMHVGPGGSAPRNFATGFASPIDVTVGPEGSLYVADWATGIIFRISYTG